MSFKKWRKIARFIKKLFASTRYSLAIKRIDIAEGEQVRVILQVIGKPIFFSYSVKEVVRDENLLFKLPPQHIKTLVTLSCQQSSVPSFEICAINPGSETLIIKENSTESLFDIHIKDINKEPELIDNFSKKDIYMFGRLYAEYQHRLESEQLQNLKATSIRLVK